VPGEDARPGGAVFLFGRPLVGVCAEVVLLGKLLTPLRFVALLASLAAACSNPSLVNDDDPFDDPFFHEGLGSGTSSLDEILREPAPSVGWLASDGFVQQRHARDGDDPQGGSGGGEDGVLLQAEGGGDASDPEGLYAGAEGDEEDVYGGRLPQRGQKSFYERAQEATLATMSVLVGAGMAALPFLVGT